jgi:hypothetical protein
MVLFFILQHVFCQIMGLLSSAASRTVQSGEPLGKLLRQLLTHADSLKKRPLLHRQGFFAMQGPADQQAVVAVAGTDAAGA